MTITAPLDHDAIERLIPHRGSMCLLARLDLADAAHIVCAATGHRDPNHPLRTASGLLAPCAIEYAAQAMALHGALIGSAEVHGPVPLPTASPGFLASAREVRLHRLRLDDLPGELRIEAWRQAGDARQILYRFEVSHGGEMVAEGRAAVVLNPALVSEPR